MNQQTQKNTQFPTHNSYHRQTSPRPIQTLNVERLEKHVLGVQHEVLKKQIELYQWRQTTDFPIVKVESFKVVQDRLEKIHLQVILNSCYQTFSQIQLVKLEDACMLLKQAFIGWQRLFNKFKLFHATSQMIVIDQKNKCRVWINSNFCLNQVEIQSPDFQTFYNNLVSIFENVTLKNTESASFYSRLKSCYCFLKGLKLIENHLKSKKLKPNTKPQIIKKIASTPNLIPSRLDKQLYSIQQQPKNLRQTIGYFRKNQRNQCKNYNQAVSFAGKNTRPLQKRIQEMIRQIPNGQITQNNNIMLRKFKEKTFEQGGQNLKKVFKSMKDFKFKKFIHEEKGQKLPLKQNDLFSSSRTAQKMVGRDSVELQTTRKNLRRNIKKTQEQLQRDVSETVKGEEQSGHLSVSETQNTSFLTNSGERLQENSVVPLNKFQSVKFSQISHHKNSQISEFNRDIENILLGFEGSCNSSPYKGTQIAKGKQTFLEGLICSTELPRRGPDNMSFLTGKSSASNKATETASKKRTQKAEEGNSNGGQYSSLKKGVERSEVSTSAKYGQVTEELEELTAEQISKKYIELGWKPALDILGFGDHKNTQMKTSIHAGEQQGWAKVKSPIQLTKLNKIKSKQLVQSLINDDFRFGG